FQTLAHDRVNRTGGRTQWIFDHEREGICLQHLFSFQSIARDVRLGERNFEIVTKLPGKITFSLDSHRFSGWAEKGDFRIQQFVFPRPVCLPPRALGFRLFWLGTFSRNSVSHTSASESLGARQSPRGESEPPDPIFGPFGMAERLNWLVLKNR